MRPTGTLAACSCSTTSATGRDDVLASNALRVARVAEIDAAITAWTVQRTVGDVLQALQAANVPVGRIYTARDIAEDPHYRARDMLLDITTEDGLELLVPGIVPKLSASPGGISRLAPRLGQDQEQLPRPAG